MRSGALKVRGIERLRDREMSPPPVNLTTPPPKDQPMRDFFGTIAFPFVITAVVVVIVIGLLIDRG